MDEGTTTPQPDAAPFCFSTRVDEAWYLPLQVAATFFERSCIVRVAKIAREARIGLSSSVQFAVFHSVVHLAGKLKSELTNRLFLRACYFLYSLWLVASALRERRHLV